MEFWTMVAGILRIFYFPKQGGPLYIWLWKTHSESDDHRTSLLLWFNKEFLFQPLVLSFSPFCSTAGLSRCEIELHVKRTDIKAQLMVYVFSKYNLVCYVGSGKILKELKFVVRNFLLAWIGMPMRMSEDNWGYIHFCTIKIIYCPMSEISTNTNSGWN